MTTLIAGCQSRRLLSADLGRALRSLLRPMRVMRVRERSDAKRWQGWVNQIRKG